MTEDANLDTHSRDSIPLIVGSLYLGNWKKGLKHGDGIARIAYANILGIFP